MKQLAERIMLGMGRGAVPLVLTCLFIAPYQMANATAAFARATGANCDKCHTANFPRLNVKGERFLRNGFQLRQEAPVEFSLGDDQPKDTEKDRSGLQKVSDIFAIGGKLEAIHVTSGGGSPAVGAPLEIDLFATGSLAKDVPIYAAITADNDAAMVHRFLIGKTNIGGSPFANVRMGTLDPTAWTSFYGFGSNIDSASPAVGAYGSSHAHSAGFTTVGASYRDKQGIEYYGYNSLFLVSLGVANGAAPASADGRAAAPNFDQLDYWTTARIEMGKESSLSLLWYNANGYVNNQTFTFAGNIRAADLDLRLQYSLDNTGTALGAAPVGTPAGHPSHKPRGITARHGGSESDGSGSTASNYRSGFTAQADYRLNDHLTGLFRYDTTDNAAAENSIETQMTVGMVYKPQPNIKMTAAYVSELDAATETGKFGDHGTLQIRFVF